MSNLLHNPHAPFVLSAITYSSIISDVEPTLAAILTLVNIAWVIYLFYREYKKRG